MCDRDTMGCLSPGGVFFFVTSMYTTDCSSFHLFRFRCRRMRAKVTLVRMRTSMRNARLRNYPQLPPTLLDLTNILRDPRYSVITMTADGLDNLYSGSVTDSEGFHSIVFASQRMLELMERTRTIFSDGTFRSVPAVQSMQTQRAQV